MFCHPLLLNPSHRPDQRCSRFPAVNWTPAGSNGAPQRPGRQGPTPTGKQKSHQGLVQIPTRNLAECCWDIPSEWGMASVPVSHRRMCVLTLNIASSRSKHLKVVFCLKVGIFHTPDRSYQSSTLYCLLPSRSLLNIRTEWCWRFLLYMFHVQRQESRSHLLLESPPIGAQIIRKNTPLIEAN